jgi:diguanylate cyclase (GGDEF)-like protein
MLAFNEATPAVLVALALGFIVGALAFSQIVGRHRYRQLARLADRLADATGTPVELAAVRRTDRVLSESFAHLASRIAEIEALATTDPLTRLDNRLACLKVLDAEVDRANRYERPLAVALIDIDHFKRVNDTPGHAMGDEVLRHVATLLRANVRSVDTLGRYGGEEFLLIMPETDIEGALASAENLRRIVARTDLVTEEARISVTISAGVTGGRSCARPTAPCTGPRPSGGISSSRIASSTRRAPSPSPASTPVRETGPSCWARPRSPHPTSACSGRSRPGPAGPAGRRS